MYKVTPMLVNAVPFNSLIILVGPGAKLSATSLFVATSNIDLVVLVEGMIFVP